MRTIETTLYQYNELTPEAQERARDNFRRSGYLDDIDQWNWQEASKSRELFLREFNAEFQRENWYRKDRVHFDNGCNWYNSIGELSYVRL